MKLKIDMHVHTRHSDSTGSVDAVLEAAERKGLDGIAITDHNTLEGAHEALERRGRLVVIPGEEVNTAQGEILALGIRRAIPKDLSITQAIWQTHIQGGLAVIPHPTVPFVGRPREKNLKTLPIDGLEVFSAITPLGRHFLEKNLKLAQRLRVPVTAGSDSHFPETVGDAYTIIYSESLILEDLLRAVKSGLTSIGGSSSRLAFKLRMVKGLFTHLF